MDEAGLRDLEHRRLEALVAGDIETARALHADDYELVAPGGQTYSREDYLDAIATGAVTYTEFRADSPIRVRRYADAAILRYQARIEVRFSDGGSDGGRFWHTDAYERRDATWVASWSQATRIREA